MDFYYLDMTGILLRNIWFMHELTTGSKNINLCLNQGVKHIEKICYVVLFIDI